MRNVLAVVVGLLIAGVITGATVPLLPQSFRQPWYTWCIVGISVAVSVYAVSRTTRTPPE